MKSKYCFTFAEAVNILRGDGSFSKQFYELGAYSYIPYQWYKGFYEYFFSRALDEEQDFMSWYKSDDTYHLQEIAKGLVDKLLITYGDYGCCSAYLRDDKDIYTSDDALIVYGWFKPFIRDFCLLLDEVYPRYATLLALYEDNKNKLIGKLQSETYTNGTNSSATNTSYNNSNSNKHIFKDTPESQIVITDDKYNSSSDFNEGADSGQNASATTGSTTGSATTTFDKDLIITQLDEVQQKYRNLVRDFIQEFRGLFFNLANFESDEED